MAKMKRTSIVPFLRGRTHEVGRGFSSIFKTHLASRTASLRKGRIWRKAAMTTLGILALALLVNFGLNTKNAEATWYATDFINQDFWSSDPEDINIITALYGDGENPETSPYTRHRTSIDCNIEEDDIIEIDSTNYTQLHTMQPNKIYLVES